MALHPGTVALLSLFVAIAGLSVPQATLAQTPTGEYRGVKVLEADPEPPPAPTPPKPTPPKPAPPKSVPLAPAVAPATTPAPAPVQQAKLNPPPPVRVLHFCDRPFSAPDLTLSAASDFDQTLSRALTGGKAVVVDLAQPYPDHDAPPAALTPWLSEVKAAGGEVTVKQYCEAARGSLSSWIAGIFGRRSTGLYRVARRYNVVLHADALDHVITQVEFDPKASGPT